MLKEGHTNTKRLHGVFSRQMREKKQYDKLRVEAFKLMAVFSVPRIYFDLFIEQFKEQFLCRAIRVLNVGFRVFRSPKLIALRRKISWH